MKRIKLFEKFVGEDKLVKFCKDNLAYLIDDGYKVVIDDDDQDPDIKNISIYKSSGSYVQSQSFKLSDIKYDLIPFLIELDKKWLLRAFSDKVSDKKIHIAYTYNAHKIKAKGIIKDDEYLSISELDDIDVKNLRMNVNINYIEFLVIRMK